MPGQLWGNYWAVAGWLLGSFWGVFFLDVQNFRWPRLGACSASGGGCRGSSLRPWWLSRVGCLEGWRGLPGVWALVGVLRAFWGLGVAGLGVWGWVGVWGFLLGSGRCCAGLELVACEAGRWRPAGFPGVRALVVMVADPGGGMSLGWS